MGNEVTTGNLPRLTSFLPQRVVALGRAVCSVQHPHEATPRYHLPIGWTIDDRDREEARNALSTLTSQLNPNAEFDGRPGRDAILAMLTTLLMGSAMGHASEVGVDAKLDLYEMALDDVPAWAVAKAIRRWMKHDCPVSIELRPNYAFPPSPATLYALASLETAYVKKLADVAQQVSVAVTSEEAMKPEPPRVAIASPAAAPQLRKM